MIKPLSNGNLGFWILGALFTLSTTLMYLDRETFHQRIEAAELWQTNHTQEVGGKEQQLWNYLSQMNVKVNHILKEMGYTDKEILEMEETATVYER